MVLPVVMVLLLLALGGMLAGRRRVGAVTLAVALLALFGAGTPPLPQALLDALQRPYPLQLPPPAPWAARSAIVLLGAGTTLAADGATEPPLVAYGRIARARVLYAQCRAAGGDCKVLVTGGDPLHHGRSEAAVYGEQLQAMGVPAADLILEERSASTWQNAQFSRALIAAYRPGRLLIVTSGLHMRRALRYFGHFGLHPEPVRGDWLQARGGWLPSGWNLTLFEQAVPEYFGLLRYRLYNVMGWNAPPQPRLPMTP